MGSALAGRRDPWDGWPRAQCSLGRRRRSKASAARRSPFLGACLEHPSTGLSRAGVTSAGMVALKASVYKAQQEAALLREGKLDMADLRTQRRAAGASVLDRSNTGVQERDSLDKLHIKARRRRCSQAAAL